MKVDRFKKFIERFSKNNKQLVLGLIVGILIGFIFITSIQPDGIVYNTLNTGDAKIEKEVRNLVLIDDDVSLSILTISDEKILQEINQDIFSDSKKGDKLIIFNNKGLIYRPETRQIVNIVTLKL